MYAIVHLICINQRQLVVDWNVRDDMFYFSKLQSYSNPHFSKNVGENYILFWGNANQIIGSGALEFCKSHKTFSVYIDGGKNKNLDHKIIFLFLLFNFCFCAVLFENWKIWIEDVI